MCLLESKIGVLVCGEYTPLFVINKHLQLRMCVSGGGAGGIIMKELFGGN